MCVNLGDMNLTAPSSSNRARKGPERGTGVYKITYCKGLLKGQRTTSGCRDLCEHAETKSGAHEERSDLWVAEDGVPLCAEARERCRLDAEKARKA